MTPQNRERKRAPSHAHSKGRERRVDDPTYRLDTFVIRPMLVPALILLLKRSRATRGVRVAVRTETGDSVVDA